VQSKGGYTLVTLPRIVTPYRDSVDETRARVTYFFVIATVIPEIYTASGIANM
jgi:hypothetical protein